MTNREYKILEYLEEFKNEVAMNLDCSIEEYYQGQYQAIKMIIEKVKEIIENDKSRND